MWRKKAKKCKATSQAWFWADCLTTETWRKLHRVCCWEIPSYHDRKKQREERAVENLHIKFKPTDKHVTKVNSGHLARTHMQAPSFITRQWSLFLDCLHTHTLKTKTAGLKMGPCHSLLGANLLCPQSCFSLSHSSPLHRVLIAHWISSSHRFVVFRKTLLLPSATLPSDQPITSDLFSKGVIVLQPFIFPWLSKCAQLPLSCSFSFSFFASWWYFLSLLLTLYIYSKYVKLQVQSAKWHLLKFHSSSKNVLRKREKGHSVILCCFLSCPFDKISSYNK